MSELKKEPFSIAVKKENINEVYKKLEKLGYKWHSGEKPTELIINCNYLDIGINNRFGWSSLRPFYSNVISAEEFLGKNNKECIVIYRKDNEIIALDKTTGKKAVAKCSPKDTYDFYTGAKLAFERLTGEDKGKLKEETNHVNCKCELNVGFNGFVECIKNEYTYKGIKMKVVENFKIGKIYEVKDGRVTSDIGFVSNTYKDVEDLSSGLGNTFVEVKKVKRHAKAGEYIEIIKADKVPNTNGKPEYTNGDILKIIEVTNSIGQVRYAKGKAGDNKERLINYKEYVVLEGYEPPKEKKQPYNGKVVCVDLCGMNSNLYTVGKVYKFENGFLTADNGETYPETARKICCFEDWQSWTGSKFIEIKE